MGTAMNIEEYKKLPLEQLRDEYGNCLIKQKYREATVNTSRTDAFYIWRNGSRGLFWQAVEADDKTAENILLGILAKKSSVNPRRNISGYMFHLRLFRSFLNIKPAEIAPAAVPEKRMTNTDSSVPKPSPAQVKHLLQPRVLEDPLVECYDRVGVIHFSCSAGREHPRIVRVLGVLLLQ